MRRRWYYFKRMLQADRLFVVQMIGNIIEMIRYAGRWIALAAVCAAVLYSGRGLFVSACEKFYENYAVRITDDVVRGFLPAWKEDEGTAFFLGNRKNGSGRQREECREIFGILEKLNDYDYLMKKFYNVHPTTTASRDLMQAADFLSADLSIEKDASVPQILIYHTHSQETYADYPKNPEADVLHLGEELARLLREKGYNVYHDESVYDDRNGKLDRSAAYTYALDGITGLLQKYPSLEVVLDIHRDGVADGTRLLTEINGTETAKIMFFNGTSMSPDGPIEYLPNPNLKENLAFSFQMQLLAAEKYPGLTRKIYLKGLRYNEHVRERSALIEVGAQTNTYAEAKAAMVPLADLLDQVLTGE